MISARPEPVCRNRIAGEAGLGSRYGLPSTLERRGRADGASVPLPESVRGTAIGSLRRECLDHVIVWNERFVY
jgi:hypothetical protein